MTSLPILLAAVSRPQGLLAFQEKREDPGTPPPKARVVKYIIHLIV